jgi:hypothetical protein
MSKSFIEGVPRYFMPTSHDCFHNALASELLFMGLSPNIILADYLSFMYDRESGYIGLNYLGKPNTTVEFTEEELNTSLGFVYLLPPAHYTDTKEVRVTNQYKDRLTIRTFIEDSSEVAYTRAKELIDNKIPVAVAIDLYYMPYHKYYKANHALHYIVLTGYDEDEQTFTAFDKNPISGCDFDGKISMEEVMLARKSDNQMSNEFAGAYFRPVRNIWAEIDSSFKLKLTDEKIRNILLESYMRMKGEKKVLGMPCGLPVLDTLREDLLAKKETGLDDKSLAFFRTYYSENFKVVSRSRRRFREFLNELGDFVPADIISDISEFLNISSTSWDVCANLCIKLGITRSVKNLDPMAEQLETIKGAEQKILDKIDQYLNK